MIPNRLQSKHLKTKSEHSKIILHQPLSISPFRLQRSVNQHYTKSQPWKNTGVKEQQAQTGVGTLGHILTRGNDHTDVFHGRWRSPAESRVLHFTSMTHRMGISKADTKGKCLLMHCAAAVTEGAISSEYRLQLLWLKWGRTKSDGQIEHEPFELSTLHTHPWVWLVGWGWGRYERGRTRSGKHLQAVFKARLLLPNLHTRGKLEGMGLMRGQCCRHYDHQNPSRHTVFLWSWADGKLTAAQM